MDRMVVNGLLEFIAEVDTPIGPLRRYYVTPDGAEAVGLPED